MKRRSKVPRILSIVLLTVAAIGFAFPFYFMLVGAFQESPTNAPNELFPTSGWTVDNFVAIDSRIDLAGSLLNSLIFTVSVLLGTVVSGCSPGTRSPVSTSADAASSGCSCCSCRWCRSSC